MVSAVGFAVSLLAIAQAATAGRDIYWRFRTEFEGPLPFGPFVNRNHFATWVIMALPLCLGYIAARIGSAGAAQPEHASARTRLAHAIDPRTAWLMAAAVTMLVALLLSLSRSGALALGVSAAGDDRHAVPAPSAIAGAGGVVMATAAVVVGLRARVGRHPGASRTRGGRADGRREPSHDLARDASRSCATSG